MCKGNGNHVCHFWRGEFQIWKGRKLEQILSCSTGIGGLHVISRFAICVCAYMVRLIGTESKVSENSNVPVVVSTLSAQI